MDPIPEVRSVAARALGSLIRGMGEENFPDLVPWLLDTLKSDGSNVERSGAAQGLSEVSYILYIYLVATLDLLPFKKSFLFVNSPRIFVLDVPMNYQSQ